MKPIKHWLLLSIATAVSIFAVGCETVDEDDRDDDHRHRGSTSTTTTTVEERRVAPVQQETRDIRSY